MEINALKTVKVDVKTFKLHIKVRDGFEGHLVDQDGATVKDYEGYVPEFFPGQPYGDYLFLDIDIDSGQITNWTAPTAEQLENFINQKDD